MQLCNQDFALTREINLVRWNFLNVVWKSIKIAADTAKNNGR